MMFGTRMHRLPMPLQIAPPDRLPDGKVDRGVLFGRSDEESRVELKIVHISSSVTVRHIKRVNTEIGFIDVHIGRLALA